MTDPDPITQAAAQPHSVPMSERRSGAPGIGRSRRARCRLAGRRGAPGGRGGAAGRPGPRRLREQPRDEARSAVSDGAARDRAALAAELGRSEPIPRARRSPTAEVAPPGFLNMRLRDGALESTIAAILADPRPGAGSPPVRPRSVNVEFVSANPTGPLHVGNARGAFIGDLLCRVLEAGGQRVTREYYFNDSGGQIPNLGASIAALRRGEPVPDDGYTATTSRSSRRRCPTMSGPPRPPPAPTRTASSVTGRPAASARASRQAWPASASGSTSGRARLAPRRRLGRARGRAPARARPRLRAGRRDLVPLDRLRRRQGPGDLPLERRADLLRGGHRLRDREVQPRLRPPDLRLGRRPSRHGRARPQRRRRRWATTRRRSRCSSTRGSASCATARRSR